MRLDVNVPKHSLWDAISPREKNCTDIFEREYTSALEFLNALSLSVAQEIATEQNLPLAFLSDFGEKTILAYAFLEDYVNSVFSSLPNKNDLQIERLISSFRHTCNVPLSVTPPLCRSINVVEFSLRPSCPVIYTGYRGGYL